jgi:hypothetical protein
MRETSFLQLPAHRPGCHKHTQQSHCEGTISDTNENASDDFLIEFCSRHSNRSHQLQFENMSTAGFSHTGEETGERTFHSPSSPPPYRPYHSVEKTSHQLEDIVRTAHENIRKLQQMTLLPSTEPSSRVGLTSSSSTSTTTKKSSKSIASNSQLKSKTRPSTATPSSLPSRSSSAPAAPKSALRKPFQQQQIQGQGEREGQEELLRKVDFLFKKVREMDQQMTGIKSDFGHLKNSTKDLQNSLTHLSDILRMDKHSIVELREQLAGMKQKLERFSQHEQLHSRSQLPPSFVHGSSPPVAPAVDVGMLSEQIFQRVHKEFTKVVDEVVRVCVSEQVDFMRKWSVKTTEDDDQEIRAQVASIKRRQNHFDERLSELKGEFPLCFPSLAPLISYPPRPSSFFSVLQTTQRIPDRRSKAAKIVFAQTPLRCRVCWR